MSLMFMRTPRNRWTGILLLALLSAACSPTLNWRDARLGDSAVVALLPCEPDHAQRSVPLGGVPRNLTMAGCEAGGATFAVMLAEAPASQANELLAGWRSATLANMKAEDVQKQPFLPRGALALPESVRISARGHRAGGEAVQAQAVWLSRIGPGGQNAQLVHLVMYSERPMPEAADTFFSGLKLQ